MDMVEKIARGLDQDAWTPHAFSVTDRQISLSMKMRRGVSVVQAQRVMETMRKALEGAMDASQIECDDESEDYGNGFDNAHAIFYQRVMDLFREPAGT